MSKSETFLKVFPTRLIKILLLALAYFVTGKLGTLLALPPGYATAIWLPSGIALAGILLFGYGYWPGVWLGSCLVNFSTTLHSFSSPLLFKSLLVVATIGMGASLEAIAGAFLIRRYIGFPSPLEEERDVATFLFLGGPVSCIIAPTIAVTTLWLAGVIPITNYPLNWGTWWIGDSIGVIIISPLILLILREKEAFSGGIWSSKHFPVIIPLVITFISVIALFIFSNSQEQTQAKIDFQRKAASLSRVLNLKFNNDFLVIRATESFFESSIGIDRQTFHEFVSDILSRRPEIETVFWEPRVTGAITDYISSSYAEPSRRNSKFLGAEILSNAACLQALSLARDRGKPMATSLVHLSHGNRRGLSFLIFAPVYIAGAPHDTLKERRENLRGFVTGVFSIEEFLASAFKGLDRESIILRIDDLSSNHPRFLYRKALSEQSEQKSKTDGENPQLAIGMEWSSPFEIAGQQWLIRFSESKEDLIAHQSWHAWLVLLAGLVFTALLGAFLLVVTRRTTRIETLVQQRTASLEASESRLRSVMQSAQDAIITCDQEGKMVSWNRAAETHFGYQESEIIGKPLSLILPTLKWEADRVATLTGPGRRTIELEGCRKDRSHVQLEISMASWKTDEQNFFSAFLRDITERKRMDQMKTDFVSFASHQLKTPLVEIHGFVGNMLSGIVGSFNAKQESYLSMIKNATIHSLRLISDLLSVSKMEQGMIATDIAPADLLEIIRYALKEYQETIKEKGLELNIIAHQETILVLADFSKAVEAIKNILDNALKFTDSGSITIDVATRNNKGVVKITDTGAGMDSAVLDRLFTKELLLRDTTNAKGGSGLGLYIAKSFMKLQEGDVTAVSSPGKGSTFTFTFRIITYVSAKKGLGSS